LVGSSSTTRCGASKQASPSSRRDFSPPDRLATGVFAASPGNPIVPARGGIELVQLVLGEIRDREPVGAGDAALARREPAGDQLGERRLAVAVGAEQRDAVVVVDPQGDAPEHRLAGLVGGGDTVERDDRRRQQPVGIGNHDLAHLVGDAGGGRLELRQQLEPRLRLARLAGLGAEPLDEGEDVRALGLLLFRELLVERLALTPLALER
jgi:hypothetical protein